MPEIGEILHKIEDLRKKLNTLAEEKSKKITDLKIVSISRELDVLLNTYHKLIQAKIELLKTK